MMQFAIGPENLNHFLTEITVGREDGFSFEPLVVLYTYNPEEIDEVYFFLTEFDEKTGQYFVHERRYPYEKHPLVAAKTGANRYPILKFKTLFNIESLCSGEDEILISIHDNSITFKSGNIEIINHEPNFIHLDEEQFNFSMNSHLSLYFL